METETFQTAKMTLSTSLSGLYIVYALLLLYVNQHMRFEVPSFTNSKDYDSGQYLKKRVM